MPNIEIHGYGIGFDKKPREIFAQIVKALEGESYADEAVVTVCQDSTTDLNLKHKPFLRICSSEYEDQVLAALEKAEINMDIEVMPIKKFIPVKE